jgi:hypothetical protein
VIALVAVVIMAGLGVRRAILGPEEPAAVQPPPSGSVSAPVAAEASTRAPQDDRVEPDASSLSAADRVPTSNTTPSQQPGRPVVVPVSVSAWPVGSPERRVAEWFDAYADQDYDAMTNMRLPSQTDREAAYNWIEGTYFFREFRELESLRVISRNDVSAEVRATWRHDMGRSYVDLFLIRENPRGNPAAGAPWSISYTSATGVRNLE